MRRPPLRLVTAALTAAFFAAPAAVPAVASHTGSVAAAAPVQAPAGDLERDIDAILDDPRLDGAQVGVVIREAESGEMLYSRGAGTHVMPASNQKLLTTAAALGVLGPGYRFRTSVLTDGFRHGSVLRGNLYLEGTGDPTMQPGDYDRLAAKIAASGVEKVSGNVVADDTWFDDVRLGRGWAARDEPNAYSPQISALTLSPGPELHTGSINVEVEPGEEGEPVNVALQPQTDYVTIENNSTTVAAGQPSTLSVQREHGTNTIVVSGEYPVDGGTFTGSSTVDGPTGYAAAVFRQALADHGVEIAGETVRGATPKGATELAQRSSRQLSELIVPLMKLSNNGMAEILVKAMGRETRGEGSWPAGLAAVEDYLKKLGVGTSQLRLADGSGLSRLDRVTAGQVAVLLSAVRSKPWFPAFYHALPVAGEKGPLVGGTLASRMRGTPAAGNVHAKTGTLTGVSALSGYVKNPRGERLVFSIVMNDVYGAVPEDLEDAIAVRLAGGSNVRRQVAPQHPARSEQARYHSSRSGEGAECSWANAC